VIPDTDSNNWVTRFWRKDPALWSSDGNVQTEIKQRLGWLDAAAFTRTRLSDIEALVQQVQADDIGQCVLLGMGGSSLAPEVLAQCFGQQAGFPELKILDTTHPDAIAAFTAQLSIPRTLFIVSSKSGTTSETLALYRYFFNAASKRAQQFIAITDPASHLQTLAETQGFRQIFLNPADIGGRYAALSLVGMVPAALAGISINPLLESAEQAARDCRQADSAAWSLGQAMATHTKSGRDKLTLVLSPVLAPLGAWIEQLVAESTGKAGHGVVAIAGEPLLDTAAYKSDRLFVQVRLRGDDDAQDTAALAALRRAGHPVLQRELVDLHQLGAAFFEWEFATAVASAQMGINPFDEPDVNSAKQRTRALLQRPPSNAMPVAFENSELCVYATTGAGGNVRAVFDQWLAQYRAGDYLAILAYLPDSAWPQLTTLRQCLRQHQPLAVTLALGPRYLHSSGQLHKGGANNGMFLVLTDDPETDLDIPGDEHSFGALIRAQALGDMAVLLDRQRRVLHLHLRQRRRGLDAILNALQNDT